MIDTEVQQLLGIQQEQPESLYLIEPQFKCLNGISHSQQEISLRNKVLNGSL